MNYGKTYDEEFFTSNEKKRSNDEKENNDENENRGSLSNNNVNLDFNNNGNISLDNNDKYLLSFRKEYLYIVGFAICWVVMLYFQKIVYSNHIYYLKSSTTEAERMMKAVNNKTLLLYFYNKDSDFQERLDRVENKYNENNNINHNKTEFVYQYNNSGIELNNKEEEISNINDINKNTQNIHNIDDTTLTPTEAQIRQGFFDFSNQKYSQEDFEKDDLIWIHDVSYHYQSFFKGLMLLIFSSIQIAIIDFKFNKEVKKVIKNIQETEDPTEQNANIEISALNLRMSKQITKLTPAVRKTINQTQQSFTNLLNTSNRLTQFNIRTTNQLNVSGTNNLTNLTNNLMNISKIDGYKSNSKFFNTKFNENTQEMETNDLSMTTKEEVHYTKIALVKILLDVGMMFCLSMLSNYMRICLSSMIISFFPFVIVYLVYFLKNQLERIQAYELVCSGVGILSILLVLKPLNSSKMNEDNWYGNAYLPGIDYNFGFILGMLFCCLTALRILMTKYASEEENSSLHYLVELRNCSVFIIAYGFFHICFKKSSAGIFPFTSLILLVIIAVLFTLSFILFLLCIESFSVKEITKLLSLIIPIGVLFSLLLGEVISLFDMICIVAYFSVFLFKIFNDYRKIDFNNTDYVNK